MKVLIIGLGSIAQKHIYALREIDDEVEIFALRSSSECTLYDGIVNLFSLKEVSEHNFTFAIISNPTSKHFETIKKFQDFDIPLFIEKPLFRGIGKKESELVEVLSHKNQLTYIACNLRFLSCLMEIKKVLKHKRVNEVNVYCGSYLAEWRPGVDFRRVYSANKEMGGGVHIDLIHELDYLYWIFGEPISSTRGFSNKSSLKISAFDYANYLWEYPGFMASVVLNYYRRDAKRTFEIVCENETYAVDILKNQISLDNEIIFTSSQKTNDTYLDQMNYFINKIIQNKTSFNSIKEAYKVLNLCLKD